MAFRYGESSAEDRSTLVSNAVPSNTRKATCFGVKVFKEYTSSVKKVDVDFKAIEPGCLAILLECFYTDVWTKKGGVYGRQAYMSARAAIQRELDLTSRNFNISKDAPFRQSNRVLDSVLKHNMAQGHEKAVEHKTPISDED